MKKLFLTFVGLLMLSVVSWAAEKSYTLTFKTNGTSEGSAFTTSSAATAVLTDGTDYVPAKPVTATSKAYPGKTGFGLKLGTSSAVGKITLALSDQGTVAATKIVVSATTYGGTYDAAAVSINDMTAQNVSKGDFADYTFTFDKATEISSISIASVKVSSGDYRLNVNSVTVYYNEDEGELLPAELMFSAETASAQIGSEFTEPLLSYKTSATITYSSSNTEVATVDATLGLVTLLKAGTTTITASAPANDTYAAGEASYVLTVTDAEPEPEYLDFNVKTALGSPTVTGTFTTATVDPITLSGDKSSGSNTPSYVKDGSDVRFYAGNKFTVSTTGNAIIKIVFNLSAQGVMRQAPLTATSGTITQTVGASTATWEGKVSSVTFTVGANADYGTDGSSSAGQFDFVSMYVYSGTEPGPEPEPEPEPEYLDFNVKTALGSPTVTGDFATATVDPITLSGDKSSGSNTPQYNITGTDVRFYAGNKFTVSTTGNAIIKIVFNLSSQGVKRQAPLTATSGTITQTVGASTATWEGNASSVTFTVGANADYGTDGSAKSGQFDFVSMYVYSGTEPGPEPGEYASLAAWIEAKPATAAAVTTPVTAVYQNGKDLFINQDNAWILVYGDVAQTYVNGDQIPAGIKGKYETYNGQIEFVPTAGSFAAATAGTAVEPTEVKAADVVEANSCHYVKLVGVKIVKDETVTSGRQYTATDADGNTVILWNRWNKTVTVTEGENMTVTGFVGMTNTVPQINVVSVTGEGPEPEPEEYATLAAWIAAKPATAATVTTPVTAVYQNGKDLYINQDNAWILVYGDVAQTYVNGDQIPAGIKGKYETYNGQIEFVPTAGSFAAATAGTAVEPTEVKAADVVEANSCHYVKLVGVKIVKDEAVTSGRQYTATDADGNTVILWNRWNKTVTVTEGENMTVTGFIGMNNTVPQINIVSVVAGEDPGPGPEPEYINFNVKTALGSPTKTQDFTTAAVDPITLSGDKSSGSNTPQYNITGTDVRFYAANKFTVSTTGNAIIKIVFNLSAQGVKRQAALTPTSGTITQTVGAETATWEGNASSVTFTVGDKAVYGTEGEDKAGQFDFVSMYVYSGTEPGPEPEPGEYATLAEWIAAKPATAAAVTTPVTAVYQNGKDLYINQDNAWILVYGDVAQTYVNGDQIPAGIKGKYDTYNGQIEFVPTAGSFAAATAGTAVEPTEVKAADVVEANSCHYVKLVGVKIVKDEAVTSGRQYTATDADGNTVILWNRWNATVTVTEGENMTVTGFVGMNKTVPQINVVSVTGEGPEPEPEEYATLAAWLAAKPATAATVTTPVTAVYQNGKDLFINQDNAWILVYGDVAQTYVNGDQIPAGIKGKYDTYNGQIEFVPTAGSFAAATAGTAVEPTEVKAADIVEANSCHYVKLVGVKVVKDEAVTSGRQYTATDADGNTVILWNRWNKTVTVTEGENMTVTGFVGMNNTVPQINIVSVVAGEDPGPGPEPEYINFNVKTALGSPTETQEFTTATVDPITLSGDKAYGSNTPSYNKDATDVRFYAANTFTVSTTGNAIVKIVFNFSEKGVQRQAAVTPTTGTVSQTYGAETATWEGNASSITFTVGDKAVYGTDGEEKAGQFDFVSMYIYTGDEPGPGPEPEPGTTVTFNFNDPTSLTPAQECTVVGQEGAIDIDGITFSAGDVTLLNEKGENSTPPRLWKAKDTSNPELRVYQGGITTIAVAEGSTITKIVLNSVYAAEGYVESIDGGSLEEMSYSGKVGTWSGEAQSLTFHWCKYTKGESTYSPYFNAISVTYVDESGIEQTIVTNDEPVEYYSLQGLRLANPAPGQIVIRRQGNNVSKILWK